jgi:hypothetical protein
MQDARTKGWAVVAILTVVASACAGAGESRPSAARTRVSASSTRHASDPDTAAVASKRVAPGPSSTAPTTTTTAAHAGAGAAAVAPLPASPPLPLVSVVAVSDGQITQSEDRPCASLSAQTIARGQLEVRRSGSTATALVVPYTVTGTEADHAPLPGQITIPAGAGSAVILVDPHLSDAPLPRHEHRSSVLQVSLQAGPGYQVAPATTAAITLRFDVDLFGCDPAHAGG